MASDTSILLLAAGILFVLTLLSGTVPILLIEFLSKRVNKSKSQTVSQPIARAHSFSSKLKGIFVKDRIVQFLAQLGGGVLLYTSLIHMLPEIREDYETYAQFKRQNTTSNGSEGSDKSSLPIVDLCSLAGFFAIFLIEELMHTFVNHDHHDPSHSDEHPANSKNASLSRRLSMRQYIQTRKHYHAHVNENECSQTANGNSHCPKNGLDLVLSEKAPISISQPTYDSCEQLEMPIDSNGFKCDVENIENIESFIYESEDRNIFGRIMDAMLLILAFSCHSVFDGISIGLQTGAGIWTVLIAILTHKLLIAFILSVQIYERCFQKVKNPSEPGGVPQRKPMKRAKPILWVFSTLFAVMSPIGIIIVIALGKTSKEETPQLHFILLAAFSAGTIIYICFLEIIDKSRSRTHISGFVQWIALLLGFSLMHLVSVFFHE